MPFRRGDRDPNSNSRVCSCHFRDGDKNRGPELFAWNVNKIFAPTSPRKKRKRTVTSNTESELQLEQATDSRTDEEKVASVSQTILEAELDCLKKELSELKEQQVYQRTRYSVAAMDSEVLRMETGLPTKDVFQIVVNYISRFRDNINYYYGWRVDSIKLEDQVFITLMKLRQNYTFTWHNYLAHCFDFCSCFAQFVF